MKAVSISFTFSAAHRLINYVGKCAALHGHSYRVTIEVGSKELDKMGFVVDFGLLKTTIKARIMANYDHNCLLHKDDPLAGILIEQAMGGANGRKIPVCFAGNPTAENIALALTQIAKEEICSIQEDHPGTPQLVLMQVIVSEEEGTEARVL